MQEVPSCKTWVTSLHPEDLDVNLFAFWVLSFAVMVGQNLDSELMVHLVPLLIQKEFSVDWLTPWSIKPICGMLGLLGLRLILPKQFVTWQLQFVIIMVE